MKVEVVKLTEAEFNQLRAEITAMVVYYEELVARTASWPEGTPNKLQLIRTHQKALINVRALLTKIEASFKARD